MSLWTKNHFLTHHWKCLSYPEPTSTSTRLSNLTELTSLIATYADYWLFGSTLRSLYTNQLLDPLDHDDDIGIWKTEWANISSLFLEAAENRSWTIIRKDPHIVSLFKNGYYIDICLFHRYRFGFSGYGYKFVPTHLLESLTEGVFYGRPFNIPFYTEQVLRYLYHPPRLVQALSFIKTYVPLISRASYINAKLKSTVTKLYLRLPHKSRILLSPLLAFFGLSYIRLNYNDFLRLNVEPSDSFNWYWRFPHLSLATNGGKYSLVSDILLYFSDPSNMRSALDNVVEVDTRHLFLSPLNFDYRFWNTGNNFFFYCIYFSFRNSVCPYSHANEYITNSVIPPLYSYDYFNSLPELNSLEIKKLFQDSPLELTDSAITGGKHRAFAMIGHLLKQRPYIPIWAILSK